MSVTSFYRVQCSGTCGRWLSRWRARPVEPVEAAEFPDWAAADKAAAEAGWHDGADGRYAPCTCVGGPPPLHELSCRINHPRLVPICPDCRNTEDSTEGATL